MKTIFFAILTIVSMSADAKCTIKDIRGDWRIIMTFAQLEDNEAEEVAQRGGEISCTVRFDKSGQYVPNSDNHCKQSGLNYLFGKVVGGSVVNSGNAPVGKSCIFEMRLEFDRPSSDDNQIVILSELFLDKSKTGFGSGLEVVQPFNDYWDAGSAWGFKPAQ